MTKIKYEQILETVFCEKKSEKVLLRILAPVGLFLIETLTHLIWKWSARDTLQTLKVWGKSKDFVDFVVETPWKYPRENQK